MNSVCIDCLFTYAKFVGIKCVARAFFPIKSIMFAFRAGGKKRIKIAGCLKFKSEQCWSIVSRLQCPGRFLLGAARCMEGDNDIKGQVNEALGFLFA